MKLTEKELAMVYQLTVNEMTKISIKTPADYVKTLMSLEIKLSDVYNKNLRKYGPKLPVNNKYAVSKNK